MSENVAIVSTYWPAKGGVATYAKYLNEEGFKHDSNILFFANKIKNRSDGPRNVLRVWNETPLFIFQILKAFHEHKIKKAHFQHEFFLYGGLINAILFIPLLLFTRLFGIKVFVTVHGVPNLNDVNSDFAKENFLSVPPFIMKFGFLVLLSSINIIANKIIVHENLFKKRMEEQYNGKREKIVVIHHGVCDINTISKTKACQQFNLNPKHKHILYFGYITGYKGVDKLVQDFNYISTNHPDWRLIIAGGPHPRAKYDRKYNEWYTNLIETIKTLPQITHFGFIPEDNVSTIFSASDVVVFPYQTVLSSSGPMALAIGAEKPILLSDKFKGIGLDNCVYCDTNSFKSLVNSPILPKLLKKERKWNNIANYHLELYTHKKILLLGSWGQDNLGDEAILKVFDHYLSNLPCNIICNSGNKNLIKKGYLKTPTYFFNTHSVGYFKLLKFLVHSDEIIFGGGTIIKTLPKQTKRNKYGTLIRILLIVLFGRIFRKKIKMLSVGIGELNGFFSIPLTKLILFLTQIISFRDKNSYQVAKNIYDRHYFETIDSVYLAQQLFYDREKNRDLPQNSQKIKVGLNYCYNFENLKWLAKVRTTIRKFVKKNPNITFYLLPFQSKFERNNDLYILKKDLADLPNVEWEGNLDLKSAISHYGKCDFVIGARYHSIIFADICKTPILVLPYAKKCSNLIRENDYKHHVDLNNLTYGVLTKAFKKLVHSVYKNGSWRGINRKSISEESILFEELLRL